MGLYKYIKKTNKKKPKEYSELIKKRLIEWRKESTPLKIENPTNVASARRLGYKAKHGFILIRIRIERGQKQRPSIRHGRRSAHFRQRLVLKKSYQWIAEERAAKKYPNLEVLNSYKIGKDGVHFWYEVILVDPNHPEIKSDKNISWIRLNKHKGRVYRGLTSAGKKSRSLRGKGKGFEKSRPSLGAHSYRAK
ncbi:50S ribosomal protein L15e [Candidatus Woesearchaeota archaeon]|nr:50S ribosomal protein L15e [Candidatus Woesearchaeota archaeon]